MASVSVSHMILFIASIVIAASVVGVFTNSITQVSEAIDQRGFAVSKNIQTDIEVISDSGSTNVYIEGNDSIMLHVKNTGSRTLPDEPDQFDVFVDGRYTTDVSTTMLGDDSDWKPGSVVRMNISTDGLSAGDHRVKIIVNEDEEVFEFRV